MNGPGRVRAETRLDAYSFLSRGYFYVPVLVPYLQGVLTEGDASTGHAASMSVLALFAVVEESPTET